MAGLTESAVEDAALAWLDRKGNRPLDPPERSGHICNSLGIKIGCGHAVGFGERG